MTRAKQATATKTRPLPPARAAALEALHRCLVQDRDAQGALDTALKGKKLDPRDVGLATELVYGYLRLKGRIEFILSGFVKDLGRIPEKFRLALGVAAYEILFLDRVPVYASVDWAVEFAKTKPAARLSGLFNAVLRRVSELGDAARDQDYYAKGAGRIEFLTRYYSCPEWIVQLWLDAYGEERTVAYLAAQASEPAVGISLWGRDDADQLFSDLAGREDLMDIEGYSFAFPPGASLPKADPPLERRSFASRQAMEMLTPEDWPTPVWDACSGRGGKSRVLMEKGISPVYASDVHMGRLRALRRDLPQVGAFRARADSGA
uniref:transcription antitermination factor NusB n=1 Tax=Salidesulfovibrio brasiliensis TaxID=221711 RepID=UPI0006CFC1D2